MSEYIIEWSGIGARITELMGSETPCLAVKHLRKERLREQIVRCRDCTWLVETNNPISSTGWWCVTNDTPRGLDGFCDWAIRRRDANGEG